MGRVVLVGRLAARDLRRRPGEAALLLLAILAATTVLTLGLLLRGVISKPYEATRTATAGPDVVAAGAPEALKTLRTLPASSGTAVRSPWWRRSWRRTAAPWWPRPKAATPQPPRSTSRSRPRAAGSGTAAR